MDMNLGSNPQAAQALGSSTLHLEEIFTGLVLHMKLPPAVAGKLPGGKQWWKIDLARSAAAAGMPGLTSLTNNPLSSDPSQMLRYLRAVSGDVTTVGTERVNGLATTHYRAAIDLSKVPDSIPAGSRKAAQQSVATLEKLTGRRDLPVAVWIDQQHLVRRMQFAITMAGQGGQSVNMSMRIDMPTYGPQPAPAVPPPDQVSDLTALLRSGGG